MAPKHRHDGTSPLPLGMDWSPPPKIWAGRDTIWPHDPRTGWSYCVKIPSWAGLPKSRDSDPVVFYRILVGIQSPEGVTTTRAILRRFNDFLKFSSALKKAFPRKNLPSAPPKGFLQLKTKAMIEERRRSLEDWMGNLLSDIDISRSADVASFLELEAAARSSFQEKNELSSESDNTVSSFQANPNISLSDLVINSSLTSEYGSDTPYQTSEIGTSSRERDNNSEPGTEDLSPDEDLTNPIDRFMKYGMSNIDEGLFMGQAILEQLETFPKYNVNAREIINKAVENNVSSGKMIINHSRKLSGESIGSDMSSQRGGEVSTSAFADVSSIQSDVQLLLPINQRQKLNGVLLTMQRRLITAKNDMEDLISRLNQEITVKDYLTTKVKDLEGELESTKQKGKENLEQAIMLERARVTQMQWDMEELRRKSMEMELRLNSQEGLNTESSKEYVNEEKDDLRKELEDLLKRHQELEVKSKADIKILVKEVKSLRNSQAELKQQLNQSHKEKTEILGILEQEKLNSEQRRSCWRKWLLECNALMSQLHECKVNLMNDKGETVINDDAMDLLLSTCDTEINLLLDKAEGLRQDLVAHSDDDTWTTDKDSMKILIDTIFTNGELRKQMNSLIRNSIKPSNHEDS